jgi:protein-S-isoprenylcysteine O-methyltransferase Ste14
MNGDAANKSRWKIAEVVFGIPFLTGIALKFLIPFPLSQGILKQALILAGIVLIISGIGFIISARREFAQHGQPTDPGRPTSKVIKTGVFAVSRNPLYLGGSIFLLGVALLLNSLWIIIILLLSMIICHYVLIIPEERYLAAKFGSEYEEYFASVNRWLGRK